MLVYTRLKGLKSQKPVCSMRSLLSSIFRKQCILRAGKYCTIMCTCCHPWHKHRQSNKSCLLSLTGRSLQIQEHTAFWQLLLADQFEPKLVCQRTQFMLYVYVKRMCDACVFVCDVLEEL